MFWGFSEFRLYHRLFCKCEQSSSRALNREEEVVILQWRHVGTTADHLGSKLEADCLFWVHSGVLYEIEASHSLLLFMRRSLLCVFSHFYFFNRLVSKNSCPGSCTVRIGGVTVSEDELLKIAWLLATSVEPRRTGCLQKPKKVS